jgi:hypothetical protein
MRYLVNSTEGILIYRCKLNKKIKSEDGMHAFLGMYPPPHMTCMYPPPYTTDCGLHAFLGTKTIESTDIMIGV